MRVPAALRALLLCLTLSTASTLAGAVKVQVRGSTQIEARATARDSKLELRGSIRDDTSRPLGQARIRVRAARDRVALGRPEGCATTAPSHVHAGNDELLVDADSAGAFCLAFPGLDPRVAIHLSFDGDRFHEKAESTVDVDSSRKVLSLGFSPAPQTLPLERESHSVWVDTRVESRGDASDGPLQLRLLLEERDGRKRELSRAAVRAGERAELGVSSSSLGDPGPANLVIEFAGSDTVQPARRSAPILRTVTVALSIPGSVAPAHPDDGLEVDVAVGSARGAVPNGAVELLVGGESVGTGRVAAGAAHLAALFPLPATGSVPVTVRYLPEAPWWIPGESLSFEAPVSPPSPWRRVPWVIAALLVAAWVVRTWWRPPRSERPDKERASLPPGRPSLDVIEMGPDNSGWRGRVIDAHEGTPIENASLTILLPTFGNEGVAARCLTDAEGRFELPAAERVEGARMQIAARWHSTMTKDLPPAGYLQVSLLSRRRALLARLVDWATRMGKPWSIPGEATPGHVATVAAERRADDVVLWADAVEQAAFGPEPPDAATEERVAAQEPAWRSPEQAAVDGRKRPSL